MGGTVWWVPWALALIVLVGVGAVCVLVGLAVRWVWRLFHPGGAHAGPAAERLWPLVGDRGSMQLDADPEWDSERVGFMMLADQVMAEARASAGPPWPDWREVAHEEDWRDQTAHDLAPATLDSGLGAGPSLAPPSPDLGSDWEARSWSEYPEQTDWEVAGSSPVLVAAEPEPELPGLHEWHDHAPLAWGAEGVAGCPSCESHWECPEPEPVGLTVAGRLIESSGEWLRRLERDAGPGWTYAGAVAA